MKPLFLSLIIYKTPQTLGMDRLRAVVHKLAEAWTRCAGY